MGYHNVLRGKEWDTELKGIVFFPMKNGEKYLKKELLMQQLTLGYFLKLSEHFCTIAFYL